MATLVFEHHTGNVSIFCFGNALNYNPQDSSQEKTLTTIQTLIAGVAPPQEPHRVLWQRIPGQLIPQSSRKVTSVHSETECCVRGRVAMHTTRADGVILQSRRLGVVCTSRDCPQLILWSEVTNRVAVLHCGRDQLHNVRGGAGVGESVVMNALPLIAQQSHAHTIHGVITLGIQAPSFPNEQYPEVTSALALRWGDLVVPDAHRKTIDLTELILRQLESYGVRRGNILHDKFDTFSDTRLASLRAKRGGHNMVYVTRLA